MFEKKAEYLKNKGTGILNANSLYLSKLSCGREYLNKLNELLSSQNSKRGSFDISGISAAVQNLFLYNNPDSCFFIAWFHKADIYAISQNAKNQNVFKPFVNTLYKISGNP